MDDLRSSDGTIECGGCDGIGVFAEGHSCNICNGSGRVFPSDDRSEPIEEVASMDLFDADELPPPSAPVEAEQIGDPNEKEQLHMFGDPKEYWREEWKGMPEFVQEDLTPLKTIYVHFEKREDVYIFSKLIGQTITMQTRAIWYPEAEIGRFANKRYIDAPPEPVADADDGIETTEL